MLSVLFAESGDNLRHLVGFYAPTAPMVLDVTFGGGTLSKRLPMRVVGVDVDLDSKAHVYADVGHLPFSDGSFQVGVCDPPYLYGSRMEAGRIVGRRTWEKQRSTWRHPNDLRAFVSKAARELGRVVSECVIFKIMDSRFKGRLVRNHAIVTEEFEARGWRLHDQVVYVRTMAGCFVNSRSAQSAHGYFLVFKPEKKRELPLSLLETVTEVGDGHAA